MKNFLSFRFFHAPEGEGTGGGGGTVATTPPAPGPQGAFDIRQHLDDAGKFKADWWKAAGVPEEYGKKFTEPSAVFKSHVSAESQLGKKGIIPPGPNATQQERDAFYTALGRPAKAEEYGFTKPEKIGDRTVPDHAWDAKRATAWQQKLYEMGVPKDQAQKIMMAAVEESVTGLSMIEDGQKAFMKQSQEALQKEWGTDYDKNLGAAQRAAKTFGDDELLKHPAIGNDPVLLRFMAKVGAATAERPGTGTRQQAGSTAMSPAEAKAEAHRLTGEIAQRIKADRNFKNSPEYATLAEKKSAAFQVAYPEG